MKIRKKEVILRELKKDHPDLNEVYINIEYRKVTMGVELGYKDYLKKIPNSTIYLNNKGIYGCSLCQLWVKEYNYHKQICDYCFPQVKVRTKRLKTAY